MKPARLRADLLAGLTTSFALVPECIAFALVAHLNPLMGPVSYTHLTLPTTPYV